MTDTPPETKGVRISAPAGVGLCAVVIALVVGIVKGSGFLIAASCFGAAVANYLTRIDGHRWADRTLALFVVVIATSLAWGISGYNKDFSIAPFVVSYIAALRMSLLYEHENEHITGGFILAFIILAAFNNVGLDAVWLALIPLCLHFSERAKYEGPMFIPGAVVCIWGLSMFIVILISAR